jgi:porin
MRRSSASGTGTAVGPVAALRLALLPLALLAAAPDGTALADEPPGGTVTGEWGGLRSRLRRAGLELSVGWTTETAYNARGGDRDIARYTDQFAFQAMLDLDRLLGLPDAKLQITFTDRNGDNLSDDARLGTLQQVQEVYGRGQTWRLTQLWYNQTYLNSLVDWKVGRLTVGEDFASFDCDFMNLTFCGSQPGNIVGDYWYNWPVSQWATRLKLNLPAATYAQVGVYQQNPGFLESHDAYLPNNPSGTKGALVPVELGWKPTLAGGTLAGSYKLGVWYNTASAHDVFEDKEGEPQVLTGRAFARRQGRYGLYLNVEQQLTRPSAADPKRGLSVFLNAAQADKRTSTLDNQVAAGLLYVGPFAARPLDGLGLAVGRTEVNDRVTRGQRLQNKAGLGPVPIQGPEYAAELFYSLHVIRGMTLRPNVQYVHDPGGTSENSDAVILGLKTVIDF